MKLTTLEAILEDRGTEPFDVIEVLQDLQELHGYLPEDVLGEVSTSMNIPLIEIFRLANFYKAFSLKPRGRHLLTVCAGTACHVRGTPKIVDAVTAQLGVAPGETTEDQAFTVETVNCLGACALGPIVVIDGRYYDHMSPAKLDVVLASIRSKDARLAPRERELAGDV
jgi:NADH:ubiquinone oxidoreductase subunit E